MRISYLLLPILLTACTPEIDKEPTKTAVVPAKSVDSTSHHAIANDCNLVLGFDAWEPYQYVDVGGRVSGLDIELISAVIDGMGCDITYQQGTWVELLAAMKTGDVDMLLGASKTPARETFALFSDAYRTEEFSLYIRKDDEVRSQYQTLTEFIDNRSRIGIVESYLYGPEVALLRDGSATSKYFVNAIMGELNVARLLDQDVDGYLEDSFVGASLLRRKALSNYIVAHGLTIQTGNAYVMFSQKSVTQEQVHQFNAQLIMVKSSQTYQQITDKYSY